ncbi:MAG: VOC family protein [Betaproteobacteria bacterium]|nr:VOC family protein [Betaproteobacteria bacterium]MDH3435377.1 VOC family protein [Betaproteobacteria bacterium]
MFTRIDHVMICVPDLQQGMEKFSKMGFNVHAGGVHTGKGTHNAIAFNQDDYIELLAIRDMAEHQASAGAPGNSHAGLAQFIEAGGGLRYLILQSDDLTAEVAAMRSRGVDVSDAMDRGRRTPAGQELRWKAAVLGPKNPLPIFFIEHLTPIEERRKQVPDAGKHPNAVFTIERAYVVTPEAEAAAALYAKVLGVPQPPMQRGMVIMSDMVVFQLGPTGLGIAQPYAPGPGAEALERRGPGPFQVLYRTKSMGAAARWMQEHGMPPLARGVRNTGEQAMLVPPGEACGAYIGFVGPE